MVFSQTYVKPHAFPVFKKGEYQDYTNYWSISPISHISKLIRKLIRRLYTFLEKKFLLFKQQCNFCNKLSTNHALIGINSKIQNA